MIRTLTSTFAPQKVEAILRPRWLAFLTLVLFSLLATSAFARGVAEDDKLFIEQSSGMQIMPFIYLGAKHMALHCKTLSEIG